MQKATKNVILYDEIMIEKSVQWSDPNVHTICVGSSEVFWHSAFIAPLEVSIVVDWLNEISLININTKTD